MKKPLIIVESPTKARTIKKFLPARYVVKASVGHVRDLPKSTLGVDVEHGFAPKYLTIKGKGEIIKDLKSAVKTASEVYLATDPDREGEAIAWHLAELLKLEDPKRIELHEITKDAALAAIKTRTRSTSRESTRSRRAAFWTVWSVTKSLRCSGRKCAEDSPRAGCSRWPYASSSTANAKFKRSFLANTGRSPRCSRRTKRSRWSSAPISSPRAVRRSPSRIKRKRTPCSPIWTARRLRLLPSSSAKSSATRPRRSRPRRCSKKPRANFAFAFAGQCRSRSLYMKGSISVPKAPSG